MAGIRPDELFNYDAMGELIEECLTVERLAAQRALVREKEQD